MRQGYLYRAEEWLGRNYSRVGNKPLEDPMWERFAELLFSGVKEFDAYTETHDTSAQSHNTTRRLAFDFARKPEIVRRVAMLRKPFLEKAKKQFQYTLDQALEECDQAQELAELQRSPEKILKAVELKAKLMKMLVSVSETRTSPLDHVSTEELVSLLAFVKEYKQREVDTIVVRGSIEESGGPQGEGTQAVRGAGTGASELSGAGPGAGEGRAEASVQGAEGARGRGEGLAGRAAVGSELSKVRPGQGQLVAEGAIVRRDPMGVTPRIHSDGYPSLGAI